MAGNDVLSAHSHTSATLIGRRCRLRGVVVNTSSGATGDVTFYDNASAASGTVLLEVDEKSQGMTDIIIPGDGILAKNGVYVSLPANVTATIFYEWVMAEKKKDSRLTRAGVSGYNKPKRTPNHPKKSHIVVAKEGDKVKTIRFGQQGVKTNQTVGQRKAFKSRHAKNISKGKMSAAYWADRVKWSPSKTKSSSPKWKKGS